MKGRHGKHHMTCFLCGPFQGCCLETTTIEGTVVFCAVCFGNNRTAVFSMRSVPATIGKLFILYTTLVNSVAMQQSKCFLCGLITGFIKPVIQCIRLKSCIWQVMSEFNHLTKSRVLRVKETPVNP
jgi:hypothetical protein